jgi:ribosomal protein S27AE
MREAPFEPSESERVKLRVVVSDIERDLACLASAAPPAEHRLAIDALTASWASLVELMALGIAPEQRQCPRCGNSGMRAATRCGYCWSALDPVATNERLQ